MKNYWAIATGINQYQHLQPLTYAQRDAQVLCDFLVDEAGFGADHCLLLTETQSIATRPAQPPSGATLQFLLNQWCQQRPQPGDTLWFFFSGYGVRFQERDYLLPIDGNPADIPGTAIAMETVMSTLRNAPVDDIVVVLDVNRSQGALDGRGVGDDTIQLAHKYGIGALLSCQPGQFSHETLALRNGFFTAAILEGLRYGKSITLQSLADYVLRRVPELTEHHWRPRQEPMLYIPAEQRYAFIVPQEPVLTRPSPGAIAPESLANYPPLPSPVPSPVSPSPVPQPVADQPNGTTPHPTSTTIPTANGQNGKDPKALSLVPYPSTTQPQTEPPPEPVPNLLNLLDDPFWRKFLVWAGAITAVLLLGVLVVNRQALLGNSEALLPSPNVSPTTPAPSVAPSGEALSPDTASPSPIASPTGEGTGQSPTDGSGDPAVPTPSGNNTGQPNPVTSPSPVAENPQLQQRNRQLLDRAIASLVTARTSSTVNQASDFARAINLARQIKQNEPLYTEAQAYISRWSQVILDIAKGRASQSNYQGAIAAAKLITSDQADIYRSAQDLILEWQPGADNQAILNEARGLIRRDQASSYNRAIALARRIGADQPLYSQAQTLIGQWSQAILTLANSRAASRNYDLAIQTASLIPQETSAYDAAQTAIANWQTLRQQTRTTTTNTPTTNTTTRR
jgi:hypothetical protein